MSDERPNGEHIEEAKEAAREEARAIGKHTVRAVLIAFVIFGAAVFTAASVVTHINTQACADRQEARDGLRDTLHDLVLTRPAPTPDDPQHREDVPPAEYTEVQARVAARIAPGGKLEPINC